MKSIGLINSLKKRKIELRSWIWLINSKLENITIENKPFKTLKVRLKFFRKNKLKKFKTNLLKSNLRDKESFTVISLASHTSSNGPSLKATNQIWTKTICKTSQILLLNILKLIRIVTKNGLITKGWDMPWFAQKTWIQRSQRTLMLLVEAFKISDFNNNYFIIIIKKQNKIYNHF